MTLVSTTEMRWLGMGVPVSSSRVYEPDASCFWHKVCKLRMLSDRGLAQFCSQNPAAWDDRRWFDMILDIVGFAEDPDQLPTSRSLSPVFEEALDYVVLTRDAIMNHVEYIKVWDDILGYHGLIMSAPMEQVHAEVGVRGRKPKWVIFKPL